MTCPDCHGKGRIELFTSAKPCAKCGGSGKVEEAQVASDIITRVGFTPGTMRDAGTVIFGVGFTTCPE